MTAECRRSYWWLLSALAFLAGLLSVLLVPTQAQAQAVEPAEAVTEAEVVALDLGNGWAVHVVLAADGGQHAVSEAYRITPPAPPLLPAPPAPDWLDARLARLAACESGGNPRAMSSGGHYGYLQFGASTWQETKARMGRPDLDLWRAQDQTLAARFLVLRGETWRWPSCWRRT